MKATDLIHHLVTAIAEDGEAEVYLSFSEQPTRPLDSVHSVGPLIFLRDADPTGGSLVSRSLGDDELIAEPRSNVVPLHRRPRINPRHPSLWRPAPFEQDHGGARHVHVLDDHEAKFVRNLLAQAKNSRLHNADLVDEAIQLLTRGGTT